jgi:hypothetical protein
MDHQQRHTFKFQHFVLYISMGGVCRGSPPETKSHQTPELPVGCDIVKYIYGKPYYGLYMYANKLNKLTTSIIVMRV